MIYLILRTNEKLLPVGFHVTGLRHGMLCPETFYDSIVVIAFYTDEIIPSSGPESFGGLPGMILGLAIPKMHTTWYATKHESVNQPPKNIVAPKEGKKYSITQFRKEIKQREWLKRISFQMLI
jgi:hypothetical protein